MVHHVLAACPHVLGGERRPRHRQTRSERNDQECYRKTDRDRCDRNPPHPSITLASKALSVPGEVPGCTRQVEPETSPPAGPPGPPLPRHQALCGRRQRGSLPHSQPRARPAPPRAEQTV